MQLIVKDNMRELIRSMEKIRLDQVPFATSKALNDTAKEIKAAMVSQMEKVFDRPTKWTLNSLYVKTSNKRNLAARVWIKNFAAKGPSPEDWLLPEVQGGQRKYKRFERALQMRGLMPQGMVVVPTKYVDTDSSGNVSGGQVTRILSYLKAFGEQGYRANMTQAGRKKFGKKQGYGYFAGAPNGQPLGIWKRINFAQGTALRPIFLFVPMPSYKPRLDFFGIGERIYSNRFETHFRNAMREAIRTAK